MKQHMQKADYSKLSQREGMFLEILCSISTEFLYSRHKLRQFVLVFNVCWRAKWLLDKLMLIKYLSVNPNT